MGRSTSLTLAPETPRLLRRPADDCDLRSLVAEMESVAFRRTVTSPDSIDATLPIDRLDRTSGKVVKFWVDAAWAGKGYPDDDIGDRRRRIRGRKFVRTAGDRPAST